MRQVEIETGMGVAKFTVFSTDEAKELARKIGGITNCTVTIHWGEHVLLKQEWYNGFVTKIPVRPEPDMSKCGVCFDPASTDNGIIGLCNECDEMLHDMAEELGV